MLDSKKWYNVDTFPRIAEALHDYCNSELGALSEPSESGGGFIHLAMYLDPAEAEKVKAYMNKLEALQ